MTRVLVIGNGAREHVIARKLVDSGATLSSLMGSMNPGIAKMSEKAIIGDFHDRELLRKHFSNVEMAWVGPEAPLANGLTDFLTNELGIPTIGPTKTLARVESSKTFTRQLLDEYNISGNPHFAVCQSIEEVEEFLRDFHSLAVKPDGLTGGKGVKVTGDHLLDEKATRGYASQLIEADGVVLLEEKLVGQEFSLQAFVDGRTITTMPIVQDYKRAYDGDMGPNTGSMGSYSHQSHTLPFLPPNALAKSKEIMIKTVHALADKTGQEYKGVLYGQFMLVGSTPYLIEYNVRFGDPEAMNVLELLKTDLTEVGHRILDGSLTNVSFASQATTCVYLVPTGYPETPNKNKIITVDPNILNSSLYYASVAEENGQVVTTGSRAIGLVARGSTVEEAREIVYSDIKRGAVCGDLRHRGDIASNVR